MKLKYCTYLIVFFVSNSLAYNYQLSPEASKMQKKLWNFGDNLDSDTVFYYANEMLRIGKELDSVQDVYMAYDWFTYIHMIRKEYPIATKYADTLLFYAKKINDFDRIYYAYEFFCRINRWQGDYNKALMYSDSSIFWLNKINSPKYYYYTYRLRTLLFIELDECDKALESIDIAQQNALKIDSMGYVCHTYELKSRIAIRTKDFEATIFNIKEWLKIAIEHDLDYSIWLAYNTIIESYHVKGWYNDALVYAYEMKDWATNKGFNEDVFHSYCIIITLNERKSNYSNALNISKEFLAWTKTVKDVNSLLKAYVWLDMIHVDFQKSKEIIDYYLEKIIIDEEIGNDRYLASNYYLIGLIYMNLMSSKQALLYFDKALNIFEKIKYNEGIADIYNCKGIVYDREENNEEALRYYRKSLELYEKLAHSNNVAVVNNNIGNIYLAYGDKIGLKFYETAKDIAERNDIKITLALIYNSLGGYFLYENMTDTSYFYLQKALSIAEEINHHKHISFAYNLLSELYEKKENYKKAFEYHTLYKRYNDSLFNKEATTRVMQLEAQHQYNEERKKQGISLLEKEKQIKTNRLVLYITIVTLLLISVIIYYLYQNKAKHAKLRYEKLKLEKKFLTHELEYKEKELADKITHLVNKNDLIAQISKELESYKERFKKENRKPVEDIVKELQFNLNKEIWKEFELRFKQVHTGFYKNLSTSFPTLTTNELKLCAFIKLNMSTKDISAITHQTANSIEVARTRLRKKLELSNKNTNLVIFLSQF